MKDLDVPNKPKLEFSDGPTVPVAMRLPEALVEKLDSVAEEKGYKRTELVKIVLDLYFQSLPSKNRKKS